VLAVAILTVSLGRLDMMMLRRRRMLLIVRVADEVRPRVWLRTLVVVEEPQERDLLSTSPC
jgi:hypothetical protein